MLQLDPAARARDVREGFQQALGEKNSNPKAFGATPGTQRERHGLRALGFRKLNPQALYGPPARIATHHPSDNFRDGRARLSWHRLSPWPRDGRAPGVQAAANPADTSNTSGAIRRAWRRYAARATARAARSYCI
jgi:hypothetical protein